MWTRWRMCVTRVCTAGSKSRRSLSRRLKSWRKSMIQLHPDCLIFRTSQGELIPCSAESVTIEMIGDASSLIDPETVREAAAAVVHYFKYDLHRDTVSVAEFSDALQRALRCFGFDVTTTTFENGVPTGTDLREVARAADDYE